MIRSKGEGRKKEREAMGEDEEGEKEAEDGVKVTDAGGKERRG